MLLLYETLLLPAIGPVAMLTDVEQTRLRAGSPLPRIYAPSELPPWIRVLTDEDVEQVGPVPASFDPLVQWPHCKPIIGHVRNQGPCGDCWAFGGTQMMQDRFCVVTGNNDTSQLLSVEDVVACMDLFIGTPGQGCDGGAPMNTYYYLSHEGIVSGGDYGEKDGKTCLPYLVPPTVGSGQVGTVPTPLCVGQNKTYNHPLCVSNYKTVNASCNEACTYSAGAALFSVGWLLNAHSLTMRRQARRLHFHLPRRRSRGQVHSGWPHERQWRDWDGGLR